MRATDILQSEHRVIEQVLTCLERMTDQALAHGRLDGDAARRAIDFFKNFADGCHHGKEEAHLFPMLEAKGFPREGGPTGVMLHEHEEGRRHIRGMESALSGAAAGDEIALLQFARHAHGYVQLLRQHILKEDQRLFVMAGRALSPQDDAELIERFERTEHIDMGDGTHEKYLEMANVLADRFQVPHAATPACACCPGHR